jgi:hypothetical protein
MSGIQFTVPTTFTDEDLPILLPSAGIAGYNYRFAAPSLIPKLGLANDDPVTTWPSYGSVDYPLTVPSGAASPTFKTNSGNPYVEFDGTDDGMAVAAYGSGTVNTVVMVMRKAGTGGTVPVFSGGGWNTSVSSNFGMNLAGNTGGIPVVAMTNDTWHVAAAVFNNNSSFLVVDGTKSVQTPASVSQTTTIFRVGRDGAFFAHFDLVELIAYPTALSEGNIATIRAALQDAYPDLL